MGSKGREVGSITTIQEKTFNTIIEMIYKLQEITFQTYELKEYRKELVKKVVDQIQALNRDNFAVKQHINIVDKYQNENDFDTLSYANTLQLAEHVAPLVPPFEDDVLAVRFDILVYQIELAILADKNYTRSKNDLVRKAQDLSKYATIPAIAEQQDLLEQIVYNDYLERAGIYDYEDIRIKLRDLIVYVPRDERERYDTNFTDEVLSIDWNESQLDNDDLANYKKKVNYYILQHQDIPPIAKLKSNQPLTHEDVDLLEHILWNELGTKDQYDSQFGKTSLGELVRSIVGLSLPVANAAFSAFLNNAGLDSRQMHFVKQTINYIVRNGLMKDLSVLQESPFTDMGNLSEIFPEQRVFMELRSVIDKINKNALAA
jgi:type I restriction enzyme R subunit